MLNASIDVDDDGVLTYHADGGESWHQVDVTLSDGVYTFSANHVIDVDRDGGLPVRGDGTLVVDVSGITRLVIETAGEYGRATMAASQVPVDVRIESRAAFISIGSRQYYAPDALGGFTAPISVVAGEGVEAATLYVDDRGWSRSRDYTITADAVEASAGFAGLTYSGVQDLVVWGSWMSADAPPSRYFVRSLAPGVRTTVRSGEDFAGRSEITVDAPERAEGASLFLESEKGGIDVFIKKTSAPVEIHPQHGRSRIVVSDGGSTAGVRDMVRIRKGSTQDVDVLVDDSAGDVARHATLSNPASGNASYQALEGAAGDGGSVWYTVYGTARFEYRAPRGLANSLELEIRQGSVFPEGPGRTISYDGGYDRTTGLASRLAIVDSLGGLGLLGAETHEVESPGSGSIVFFDLEDAMRGHLVYSGVSPGGLTDSAAVDDYTFRYRGGPDPAAAITAGPIPGSLLVTSLSTPPAFAGFTVAGKLRMTIDTGGVATVPTLVDYASEVPAGVLAYLTVVTSPNDRVDEIRLPPGVAFEVRATATPRPLPENPPDPTPGPPAPPQVDPAAPAPESHPVPTPATDPVGQPPAPPAVVIPEPPPSSPVVEAGFAERFGATMRRGPGGPAVEPGPSWRDLRVARRMRLAETRALRAERRLIVIWPGSTSAPIIARPHRVV